MPTRLGLLLRAAETYPHERYGLDAKVCWSRLWLVLPQTTRDELSSARARLDEAAVGWLWSGPMLLWVPLAGWVAAPTLAGLLLFHRHALRDARVYGALIAAAFDLHRRARRPGDRQAGHNRPTGRPPMPLITIREQQGTGGANATVSFDHGPEYPATVTDPFSQQDEELLEWYFEEYLCFPFVEEVSFQRAAASIRPYGERLFDQLFADRKAQRAYGDALGRGLENLCIEVKGSPEFHRLHWEALKDPELPRAFALECPLLRRNLTPPALAAEPRPADTLRILLVTARPFGERDVAYRTISRPLVEALDNARLPVEVHILRPGSYQALVEHLNETRDRHGAGHYHVVHFDAHGAVLDWATLTQAQEPARPERYLFRGRYGRADLQPFDGRKGFLFLDGEPGRGDLVADHELAALLTGHAIPVVVLNACQSGKQVGERESSLGARLMAAGVQWVLAMGYSVTVSAAEKLMTTLYRRLFDGDALPAALRRARLALHDEPERSAYYDQRIALADWLLPVVYENRPVALHLTPPGPEALARRYTALAGRFRAPAPRYGFHGRDLDILAIERRLPDHNLLLLRGMAGAGKSTLLRHLGQWWQTTRLVERVWYVTYEERAWPLEAILHRLALGDPERPGSGLLAEAERDAWDRLPPAAQRELLVERLRADRHLLVLDNLESVTGEHLAIPNTLDAGQQAALRAFLERLKGGRSLVLLGSRGPESWLVGQGPLDPAHVHELEGLDPEAASTLAERVLERHKATAWRTDPDLERLLKLLAGFPLAIEVVLANLADQTPAQVLAALTVGDDALDLDKGGDKTRSLLRCIEYSHGRLSPGAQDLLACLAPFQGVVNQQFLGPYSEALRQQPPLAGLPFEQWEAVLREATDWGLVSAHEVPGYLRLQPTLPYFLRGRLAQGGREAAVHEAFRLTYDQVGPALATLLRSKEPREHQLGQVLTRLEYENLYRALELALAAHASVVEVYPPLSLYLDTLHDEIRGLALGSMVMERLERYPAEALAGEMGVGLVGVVDDVAKHFLLLKRYAEAQSAYERALKLLEGNDSLERGAVESGKAGMFHQLGRVAREQRQWTHACDYYQKALDIFIDLGDSRSQAGTYHQLGIVAQAQRQWAQASDYYYSALEICIALDDAHGKAGTYHQLGSVAQARHQWALARDYYQKALDIYIDFNYQHEQAGTYHQLGLVAQEQRQLAQARGYYRNALDIYIAFGDRHSQARTYHQFGTVAHEQRQWAQARDYYQKALDIYIAFDDAYEQAGTYHQLGRVAQEQGEPTQAADYLLKALALFAAHDDPHNLAIAIRSLARLHRAASDLDLPGRLAATLGFTADEAAQLLAQAAPDAPAGDDTGDPND